MKIHALTLTWNGKEKLQALRKGFCTNLLKLQNEGIKTAVWRIRDNGSKDGTINELNSWIFKGDCPISPIVHDISHNRDSFARGINYLFEKADPDDNDIILLLNNDVVFNDDDSLSKMYRLMKKTNAAVVGARLLYSNTTKLQHAGVIFSERYGRMPYHFRPGEESDANAEKDRYFQAVTAAVCLVKASSFRRIEGLDEGYRWAFEDIDMCLEIGKTEKIAYCGKTKIFHEESASLKKNPVNKMFLQSNIKHFKDKWSNNYTIDHDLYLKNANYNVINA